jgi:NAD+ diphosphatase
MVFMVSTPCAGGIKASAYVRKRSYSQAFSKNDDTYESAEDMQILNDSHFKHCPRCGNNGLVSDFIKSFRCPACDFVFYLNPAAAVAGLVVNADAELLVVVRNHAPAKGTWDLPGGFLDPGETCEEGLRRELNEELNLEIVSSRYFCSAPNEYAYGGVVYPTVDAAFICEIDPTQAIETDADEIASAGFLPLSEIKVAKFGLPSIRTIVSDFLRRYQSGICH